MKRIRTLEPNAPEVEGTDADPESARKPLMRDADASGPQQVRPLYLVPTPVHEDLPGISGPETRKPGAISTMVVVEGPRGKSMGPEEKGEQVQSGALTTAEVTRSLVNQPGRLLKMSKRAPGPKSLTHEQRLNVKRMTLLLKDKLGSGTEIHKVTTLSQQSVSNILTDKPIGIHVAREIARYAGIPVEQLLLGDLVPDALEAVIRRHRGRWSKAAVKGVRGQASDLSPEDGSAFSEDYWEDKLDRADAFFGDIFGSKDAPRRKK